MEAITSRILAASRREASSAFWHTGLSEFLLPGSPDSGAPVWGRMLPRVSTEEHAMNRCNVEELRDELRRLMLEHIESLEKETFGGLNKEDVRQQEERLKRIREVSADFLAALKRENRLPDVSQASPREKENK